MRLTCAVAVGVLAVLEHAPRAQPAAPPAAAWPQFRGASAGVAADDPALPERWSETENVVWKIDIPGRSWSSPVVWGDHVFVTSAVNATGTDAPLKPVSAYQGRSLGGVMTFADVATSTDRYRWMLYDIDVRTGKVRWERELHASVPREPVHQKNSLASETPATDGERVYAFVGNAGLFAFDFSGEPAWSQPIGPHKMRTGWGTAASPVVHRGRVYVVSDNEEQSFLAAFDARTGKQVWRVTRDEGSNWTTPFIWEHERGSHIVTTGTKRVRAYDLDGKPAWELPGLGTIVIPTPFAANGLLFLTAGYPTDAVRPLYAIKPNASGNIALKDGETSNESIAWFRSNVGPYNPSPIVYRDILYTLLDRGFWLAHDARTGEEVYARTRVSSDSTGFTASPWAYNGKLFALSEDGDTFVIQAGPDFKVLGRNPLNEMTLASPAVAHGSLFVRTASKLYRIGRGTGH